MTVENGFVRRIARWIMRVEAAGNVLRIALFGGTFLTTGLTALQQYGYSRYAWPFIGITGSTILLFAYVYAEFGVFNQKSRDMADVGDNYSGPTMLMDGRIRAEQLAMLAYILQSQDNANIEEIREQMHSLTDEQWAQLRDGIEIDNI